MSVSESALEEELEEKGFEEEEILEVKEEILMDSPERLTKNVIGMGGGIFTGYNIAMAGAIAGSDLILFGALIGAIASTAYFCRRVDKQIKNPVVDQKKIEPPYNPKNVAEQASEYIKE